jgi:UbiD family decarboxylase
MGPAGVPPAPIPTLRDYLAMRQAEGSCRRVTDAVESRFELSAYLSELDGGPAVIFDDVRSDGRRYDLPVVGNLFASRARIAGALGVAAAQLPEQLVAALEQPISPVTVGDGP